MPLRRGTHAPELHPRLIDVIRTNMQTCFIGRPMTKSSCQLGPLDVVDFASSPRRIAAKYSGKDLQADEVIVECNLNYSGKRDRWNGYDPSAHKKHVTEYELQEAERKAVKVYDNL